MYDYSKPLQKFYKDEVSIEQPVRDMLRDQKNRTEERLKAGLAKIGKPKASRFQVHGGYAMKTVVQHPKDDYDIDDGVIFTADNLKTSQGNPLSALDARKMVLDALDDGKKPAPELHTHCVRIPYAAGHHIDMPVYRETKSFLGTISHEIAGADWRKSDPKGVTEWFDRKVEQKSPDSSNDRQMRRIVAYIKALGKTRDSWNAPTGFMITKLVDECYAADARDDVALIKTLRSMQVRLKLSLVIDHPVVDEKLTKGDEDSRCVFFRDKLPTLLGFVDVLDDPDCSEADAAGAWDSLFRTSYFTDKLSETAKAFSTLTSAGSAAQVIRGGDKRYG
jgi:hypothetical protein